MTDQIERPNRPALSLHVPEPEARPGEEVDFSHIEIPAAGAVRARDITAPAAAKRAARPVEEVDFGHIQSPAAGPLRRPDISASASDTRELVYSLVRVLDDDGAAVGPWDPRLDPDTLRRMLRDMMMVRAYDDRMYRAQRQGKTSFYMKSTGEEAVAVAAAHAMDRDDMFFPTYRQQGLLVARDYPLVKLMCQGYSK